MRVKFDEITCVVLCAKKHSPYMDFMHRPSKRTHLYKPYDNVHGKDFEICQGINHRRILT